jgi:hypothetical protein
MRVVEWAKIARLVRVTGRKLVPARKHSALADRPLDLALKLLDAYPKLGKSLFPRGYWRQSIVGDEFAAIGSALLTALLRGAGQVPVADLSDMAEGMIEERYELSTITEIQRDRLHGTIEADVRIALSHLRARASRSSAATPMRPTSTETSTGPRPPQSSPTWAIRRYQYPALHA